MSVNLRDGVGQALRRPVATRHLTHGSFLISYERKGRVSDPFGDLVNFGFTKPT
jgi:hypothetical protein